MRPVQSNIHSVKLNRSRKTTTNINKYRGKNVDPMVSGKMSKKMYKNGMAVEKKEIYKKLSKKQNMEIRIVKNYKKEKSDKNEISAHRIQNIGKGSIKIKKSKAHKEKPRNRAIVILKNKRQRSEVENRARTELIKRRRGITDFHNVEMDNIRRSDTTDDFREICSVIGNNKQSDHAKTCFQKKRCSRIGNRLSPNIKIQMLDVTNDRTTKNDRTVKNDSTVKNDRIENITLDMIDNSYDLGEIIDDNMDELLKTNEICHESREIGVDTLKKDPILRSMFDLSEEFDRSPNDHVSDTHSTCDNVRTDNKIHLKDYKNNFGMSFEQKCLTENCIFVNYKGDESSQTTVTRSIIRL